MMQQQIPQIQQPVMKQGIAGRMVKTIDEIAPNEIPMDGSIALFPTQDGSTIFAKGWNTDGTISTIEYAPVSKEVAESTSLTLDDISDQLKEIQNLLKKSTPKKTAKKVSEDEPAWFYACDDKVKSYNR